jgi:ApbE superfamily uncharacterized protein (UPF0280 family)
MILFSARVGVGPMAAVAGAISQYVGSDLRQFSRNVIIENGGDDYIFSERDVIASIYAGKSPFGDKLRIKLKAQDLPMGVCTSSGTIGHSLSFGRADAVTVLSKSAILADAAATAIGNRVKDKTCINESLHWGMSIEEVLGVLIIIDDKLGMAGQIELA